MTHFNLNRMLQGCSAFIQMMAGDRAARNGAKRVNNHVLPLTCPLLASSLRLTCPLQLRRIALIFAVLVMSIANIGMAWAQTSWVRLDSIDFTNTTNFPAVTYTGQSATVHGVFFRAKSSKNVKVNNTTPGVDFDGTNINSSGDHGIAIPVTGVNGSLKVIVYHDYNNTSASHKVGISHAEGNDPSASQTWDVAPSNSGTLNKNDFVMTKSSLTGTAYIVWVGETSTSYKVIKRVAIYTEAPSCDAADLTASNITSNGDQEAGTGITFSKVGSPASGDTWYWQTSATGTDKTYNATSPYTTATTAGSYTVYLRAYNTAGNCWGTAASMTNTIYPAPSAMIHNTFVVNDAWSSTIATQDKTNITGLNAMAAVGESVGSGSNKSGLTQKIPSQSSEDAGKYMSLSFNVASGKQLNVTSVVFDEQPVDNIGTFKVSISDNQGSATKTQTIASGAAGSKHTLTLDGDIVGSFKGTVTVKVWAYGWSGGYRFGNYFYINGTVEEVPSCPAFEVRRVGTEATPAGGVALGSNAGTLTCEAVTGTIVSYQWKQNTSGTKVGAVNAIGTGVTSANFSPSPAAAGSYWYYCVATDACGNTSETGLSGEFRFNAAATWEVLGSWNSWAAGTALTGTGTVTGTVSLAADTRYAFKFKEGETWYGNGGTIITTTSGWEFSSGGFDTYLHTGPAGDYTFSINTSNKQVTVTYPTVTHPNEHYVYFKNTDVWGSVKGYMSNSGNDNKSAAWPGSDMQATTTICGELYHYAALNAMGDTYNTIIFNNGNSGYGNQTSDLPTTGSLGKYNANKDATWHDLTYTINYDKGTGTGTMAPTSVCVGADQVLPSNTFEKTGYDFASWTASASVKVGGSSVTTGIADEATIQDVTANVTLTAQWTPVQYDVTLEKGSAPSAPAGNSGSAKVLYDAGALTNIAHATWTGHVLTGYYTSNSSGTKVLNADGTFAAANVSGYITDSKWTRAENTILKAQWEAKTTTITINANTANHGSTTPGTVTATYGSALPSFTAAVGASGYDLTGYYTAATDGTKIINADGTLVASTAYADGSSHWNSELASLTLYAQYEEEVVSPSKCITFNDALATHVTASGTTYDGVTYTYSLNSTISTSDGANLSENDNYLHLDIASLGTINKVVVTIKSIGSANKDSKGIKYGFGASSISPSLTRYNFDNGAELELTPASGTPTGFKVQRSGTSIKIEEICIYYTPTACSAPTSPTISGGGAKLQHDEITLTASATGTNASTTYTWYRGNSGEAAAIDAGAIQTAKTAASGGNTYSIADCATTDAAVYYCVISNGATCNVTASTSISVTAAYTLTYDANAGGDAVSNLPEPEVHTPGTYTLSTKVPTRTGYTFDCWNRNAAGTGDCFATGASFTTGASNETLYAKWTADECTPTTLFSMVVADSGSDADVARQGGTLSLTTSNHLSTLTGGTATLKNNYASTGSAHKMVGKDNDERHLRLKQNDHLLIVTFENALAEGDIISFTGYGSNQLSFTTTETRATSPATSSKSYTIPSASGLIGATTIYIWRSSGSDTYIKSLTVTRPCDESAETCKTPNITNIASTTNMTKAETKSLNVTLGNADALTGTVSYAWTNSDGTAIDAAAKATGSTTARLTLTEPAAGTYTFICTVTNNCGGDGSQSATSAVFTVVVTESTGCTEIAKVIVSSASAGTGSGTKIAETGGYGVNLEDTKTTHDGKDGYKLGSSKYVYLQLASGEQFQNGDKVKVYITNLSDQGDHNLHIFQGTTAAGTEVATVESPALGWNEATLSGVTTGNRSLTIHRSSGTTEQNHGIYAFAVERCVDCTPATHEGLAYTKTSYTVGETAEALTVTNPENVDSYQWKWNTTGDRTSGSNCGTNSASFTPPATAEAEGTRYYWCELTNDCGTVKTSAVGITVSAVLSDVTVTWTDPAEVNYGGGGYTITAQVTPAAWNGTLTASMLTAPDGIRIYDVEINNTAHTLQAKFDVQTTFDREANATAIPFALTLDATATYKSKISEHNVTYAACAGGGGGSNVYVIGYSNSDATNISSSANFRAYETASNWYTAGNTSFTEKTTTDGVTISATVAGYYWQNNGTFTTSSSSNCRLKTIKMGNGNNPTIRWTNESLAFSKVRIIGRNTSGKEATTLTVSNDDGTTTKTFTFAAGSSAVQTKEVEMDFVSGNTKGIVVSGGEKEINVLVELIPAGAGGTLPTALTWSNSQKSGATLEKDEGTADFAITAVRDAAATTSLGVVTYSSSDASVATVNETTGQVHIADNIDFGGATYKETTITATLAASGCYMRAEITYVLRVNASPCEDVAGTVTSNTVDCTTTLTLSDYTTGATIQWYKDGVSLGSADGAQTATYVPTSAGDYYAVTHKTCYRTSNTVTVTSTAVSATKIVDEWYVKNGRRTPDIALVQTTNATGFTVKVGDETITAIGGCEFYLGVDGIIYLKGAKNDGTAPSGMTEGADVLSITATGCSNAAPVSVTIHRQVETDKYVLAYVVTGDQDGGWTQNPPANQTTGVELYRTLTNHFDLQATNVYATTDEQKIKEYYSRYDIIFITDYPNTKTKNETTKKSYVDALGALIDIRPILTMEAWVSGLTNWSEKGVKGSPKSPTTRQYNMLLQCKDHEIFSGTTVETIGEGDDVKFKINMVDSTKALYDTLDTKYGAGTHEEKKGYCYGKHPALQGFIYDETLADMLPLGLIDDGEGNNLQVGLERQKEMEARMMVLGINADAMERLSEDGETVIVNALKYLMKKDAEDISDCSIYFDNAGGDNLWRNVANWGPSHLTLPQPTQEARILQRCIVDGEANAASIKIISGGKYNHGSTTANGSLTIAKSGILKVGGRIVAATAPNYYEVRPTDATKLIIQADDVQTGALIHGHKSGELNATVQLVSSSYSELETVGGKTKKKKYWQYIGLPVQNALAEDAFYGAYTYKYNEPSGWEKKGTGTTLEEFWGIGLSVDNLALGISSPVTFNISGALALATDRDIELTKTAEAGEGENMIGNSWTAPIHLVNMTDDDFENAKATIYIYNTGRDEQAPGGDVGKSTSNHGSTQPGQWISIPVGATKLDPWQGPSVIPAMQAFEVDVADGSTSGTLHLNYDKHVRNIGTAPQENAALKAPKRYQSDEPSMMRLRVADTATYTDLYLIEGEEFSDEFDNGYDGKYQQCDGRSATLYALSPIGNMAVLAQQSINNTAIVFRPGRQNEYTFTFGYDGEVTYYLNDLLLEKSTEIREGNEYRFTCNEGDMESRFVVSTTPFGAPDITTGIGNAGHPEKVQKIMYKDHIYIIRAGRVYDIVGKEVR